jgi:hypothetical protein
MGPVFGTGGDRRFWGETWTDAPTVLSNIRDLLQRSQSARAIKIDDGWQMGRDISVQVGRWTWLDLRVLVEDHGSGKGLARVDRRVRLVASGVIRVLIAVAVAVSVVAIGLLPESPFGYIALGVVALAALRWTFRAVLKIISTDRCIAEAVATQDMQPVAAPAVASSPSKLVTTQAKKSSS